ncbi:uncharacterized protein LOC135479145 isoform X2 [Liolophura sinensis]|uniref:uncharacterized protein LOC135479145 isoform X2 n=1 Tax=Liolophura sinensis TaxID=3198878 RepID=UPI003159810E
MSVHSDQTATGASQPQNTGKIYYYIYILRQKMIKGEPVNDVQRGLKCIQSDYDLLKKLLDKLYKYTGICMAASLVDWNSSLRKELQSFEKEVTDYIQAHGTSEHQLVSTRSHMDTGESANSEAEILSRAFTTEGDNRENASENVRFNKLILHIARHINDEEVKEIKILLQGCRHMISNELQRISDPKDFCLHLMNTGYFTRNNIVAIQALLWNLRNILLYNEVSKMASNIKDILYFCEPNPIPATDHDCVTIHYKQKPSEEEVQSLQQKFASVFGIPWNFVLIVGSKPTRSWYITLMFPAVCTEKFLKSDLKAELFSEQVIDTIDLHGETIDLSGEKKAAKQEEKTMESSYDQETASMETHEKLIASVKKCNDKLNKLIDYIAENIKDEEVKKMKVLLQGCEQMASNDLERISNPKDLCVHLKKAAYFTPNNVISVQALLWNVGNIALYDEVSKIAEETKDILYLCEPNPIPGLKRDFPIKPTEEKAPEEQNFMEAGPSEEFQRVKRLKSDSPIKPTEEKTSKEQLFTEAGHREGFQLVKRLKSDFPIKPTKEKAPEEQHFMGAGLSEEFQRVERLKSDSPIKPTEEKTSKEQLFTEAGHREGFQLVKKPTLRFTETDDSELRITDSGSVVKGEDLYWDDRWMRAVTGGRYQTGRYYWEIHITCSHGCICRVGVTQESCGVSEETDPGRNSWYIGMLYRGDEVWCDSDSGGGEIKPDYRQYRRYTRPLHLGVYLDCDEHTLTVLDCDNNQVMYTDSGVIVTEPLVPSVGFGGMSESVSARLVSGDSATLPQVLCDMIGTS